MTTHTRRGLAVVDLRPPAHRGGDGVPQYGKRPPPSYQVTMSAVLWNVTSGT